MDMSDRQNTSYRQVVLGPVCILKGFVSLAKRESDPPKAISTIHAPVLGMVCTEPVVDFGRYVHVWVQNQGISPKGFLECRPERYKVFWARLL